MLEAVTPLVMQSVAALGDAVRGLLLPAAGVRGCSGWRSRAAR